MSLSRAPFFSARYFQAPTTQTKDQAIIGKNGLLKISVEGKKNPKNVYEIMGAWRLGRTQYKR